MLQISIHAPRTGSDRVIVTASSVNIHFNPRSPHGERLAREGLRADSGKISIHAPRTGSDRATRPPKPASSHFNPRSPHGERRSPTQNSRCHRRISIHAPRTGSDHFLRGVGGGVGISIHAPRTGSDLRIRFMCLDGGISIHAPRTGSDHSRRLTRAATSDISIHAPRTGSDGIETETIRFKRQFQSTLPARGATIHLPLPFPSPQISIHAPRTGSDGSHEGRSGRLRAFQSTLPARGATKPQPKNAENPADFNPRSPHGERLRKVTILSIRIIGFAQKVYHKTVLLRISLAENAVILPEKPRNPVRTSLQKAGGLRFARAIRAARPYSISSPSGA